ncbi:MAG: YciI family protein [Methanomicrobiales archaeon]|jgi:uncharacterized protein YciI|nr:YciI family protein [Methanomicrobiales archaeon]
MQEDKKYFAAILASPRPTFPMDMSDEEQKIMEEHAIFWETLLHSGQGVITGPILDPKGAYGFGVVIADSVEDASSLLENDPAQKISTYEIYQMLAKLAEK